MDFRAEDRQPFQEPAVPRDWPFFLAFDLLAVNGDDLRSLPLLFRKRALNRIMPRIESRLRFMEHIQMRGVDLFRAACERDLEGRHRRPARHAR